MEGQIFVTFLISFILRVLPQIESSEPLTALTYGWVLVVTLSALIVTAVGLSAHQVWRRRSGRRTSEEVGGEVMLELGEGLVAEQHNEEK